MALSNWDTLAVDHTGKPCRGLFTSPKGISVEFYKNWLYVRDPKAWHEGSSYVKPTIMQISHGSLTYGDVQIEAIRGPKNGIYALVYSTQYPDYRIDEGKVSITEGSKLKDPVTTGMVGIGCYGFRNEADIILPEMGRKPEPGDDWGTSSTFGGGLPDRHVLHNYRTGEEIECREVSMEELWAGVEQAEVDFLKKFLDDEDSSFPDEFRKLDLSNAVRFNQGDAFFADHLGADVPGTAPGETKEPMIGKLIEGMKQE